MGQAGDIGDVAGNGDYMKALGGITAKVLPMPSSSDQYFAAEDSQNEVKFLQRGVFDPIQTIWGHMAGGGGNPVDAKFMDGKVSGFLSGRMI